MARKTTALRVVELTPDVRERVLDSLDGEITDDKARADLYDRTLWLWKETLERHAAALAKAYREAQGEA